MASEQLEALQRLSQMIASSAGVRCSFLFQSDIERGEHVIELIYLTPDGEVTVTSRKENLQDAINACWTVVKGHLL